MSDAIVDQYKKEFLAEIELGLEATFAEEEVVPDLAEEMNDMYAPFEFADGYEAAAGMTRWLTGTPLPSSYSRPR